MPLPVIKEVSDSEQSDSKKPPAEQPTHEGLKYNSSPSSIAHCLDFINVVKKLLKRWGGK